LEEGRGEWGDHLPPLTTFLTLKWVREREREREGEREICGNHCFKKRERGGEIYFLYVYTLLKLLWYQC
jgi:hypothetical protein